MNNAGAAGTVITSRSKAFDCLNTELLSAKLNAYGFSWSAFRFIQTFLTDRKQMVITFGSFSM